jgi:hypothetical protein
MIQAVVHPGQRGGMGMHYTSVTNIMKVIGPLCLNELYDDLKKSGDDTGKRMMLSHSAIVRARRHGLACVRWWQDRAHLFMSAREIQPGFRHGRATWGNGRGGSYSTTALQHYRTLNALNSIEYAFHSFFFVFLFFHISNALDPIQQS